MKLSSMLLAASSAAAAPGQLCRGSGPRDVRDLPIVRDGSRLLLDGRPWRAVGANVYWLGLDENVTPPPGEPYYAPLRASYPSRGRITEAMAAARALGATVVRAHTLGVSTGNPLSVMPAPGRVNERAFAPIDWAVREARRHGLRLLVPLTDNYDYYHGGKYDFLRWAGFNLTQAADAGSPLVQRFYTDPAVRAAFRGYVRALLTHVSPLTGLRLADDPTVFAYETGNELAGPAWGDMDVPADWVREVGALVKALAPRKLLVDGTYGVNATHLAVDEVDIFSNHYYPPSLSKLRGDLELVASANKAYFAGEYDWVGASASASAADADLAAWYQALEQSPVVAGDAFWSLFGHNVPDCSVYVNHSDGFALQYGNPENSAYTDSRIRMIRQHSIKMSHGVDVGADAPLPAVPCPAPETPGRPVRH